MIATNGDQDVSALLAELAMGVMTRRLYGPDHPRGAETGRRVASLVGDLTGVLGVDALTLLDVEGELFVESMPTGQVSAQSHAVVQAMRRAGIERITVSRSVRPAEVETLLEALAAAEPPDLPEMEGIRVGRATIAGTESGGDTDLSRPPAVLLRSRLALLRETLDGFAGGGPPRVGPLRDIVRELESCIDRGSPPFELMAELGSAQDWPAVHAHNVGVLSLVLGRALGLSPTIRADLAGAALVHDVGKVGAPPEEIEAELRLDGDRLEGIPSHPEQGLERLVSVPALPAVAPIVALEHHWDLEGRGWPVLVKRRPPHPAARIVAVAETVDILHTVRGRQGRATRESVLASLRARSGTVLEPRLVAMARMLVEDA